MPEIKMILTSCGGICKHTVTVTVSPVGYWYMSWVIYAVWVSRYVLVSSWSAGVI